MNSPARRILVINGKGGCGKTTIATNLAVAYANRGTKVALLDNDPQASSTFWAEQRPQELPPVSVIAKHERPKMYQTQSFHHRLPEATDLVITDGHSNARGRDMDTLLRQNDMILVPVLPSAIDIRAGERFITDLLTHPIYRRQPIPVAVVANRIQPNTHSHEKLMHFLGCLDIPCVAQFRDSPVYTDAAETGQGVVDMKDCRAARKETAQWKQLLQWIDELATTAQAPIPGRLNKLGRVENANNQSVEANSANPALNTEVHPLANRLRPRAVSRPHTNTLGDDNSTIDTDIAKGT